MIERDKRFKAPGEERAYSIKGVWDKHHEIKRYLLLGKSNKEIAQVLGITSQNVSDVRNSPIMKREMATLQVVRDRECLDICKILNQDAVKSVKLLQEVRDGKHDATLGQTMKAATELLNRNPETAIVSKQQTQSVNVNVTPEDLEEIKKRAREASEAFKQEQTREVEPEKEEKVA